MMFFSHVTRSIGLEVCYECLCIHPSSVLFFIFIVMSAAKTAPENGRALPMAALCFVLGGVAQGMVNTMLRRPTFYREYLSINNILNDGLDHYLGFNSRISSSCWCEI
jgi:hypothetical protein